MSRLLVVVIGFAWRRRVGDPVKNTSAYVYVYVHVISGAFCWPGGRRDAVLGLRGVVGSTKSADGMSSYFFFGARSRTGTGRTNRT